MYRVLWFFLKLKGGGVSGCNVNVMPTSSSLSYDIKRI